MRKHAYFDLWVHSDEELEGILGERVLKRQVLNEWPLSFVELLELEGGQKLVYKSQNRESSVELEVYEAAKSDLLPGHRVLDSGEGGLAMLLEYVEAPLLKDLRLSEESSCEMGEKVVEAVGSIEGDLPFHLDLGSKEKWLEEFGFILGSIEDLVTEGKFGERVVAGLDELVWVRDSQEIHNLVEAESRVIHGDTNGGNILVDGEQIYLIDWQRPMRAPARLDYVNLLLNQGIDPVGRVENSVLKVLYFTRLHWAIECQTRWFPDGNYEGWVLNAIEGMRG